MRRVQLDSGALALAIATARGETTGFPPEADAGWDALVATGLATEAGVLEPHWATALAVISTARLAHHVSSHYGDLVHLSDIFVDEALTVSVLRRQRIDLATGQVTGVDPEAELTLAMGDQVWTLAKRTLPPLEEFTADPHQALPRDEQAVELPAELIASLQAVASAGADPRASLISAPGLPSDVRDFLNADASVTCFTVMKSEDVNAAGIAVMFWARGEHGLYRIASGDRPGLFITRPGDLGFRLLWTGLGAADLTSTHGGAAR